MLKFPLPKLSRYLQNNLFTFFFMSIILGVDWKLNIFPYFYAKIAPLVSGYLHLNEIRSWFLFFWWSISQNTWNIVLHRPFLWWEPLWSVFHANSDGSIEQDGIICGVDWTNTCRMYSDIVVWLCSLQTVSWQLWWGLRGILSFLSFSVQNESYTEFGPYVFMIRINKMKSHKVYK